MAQPRVLLGFASAADHDIGELTGAVLVHLYGNPTFGAPPISAADLQTVLTDFTSAIAAQAQGGTAATANKEYMRGALIGLLRQLALYVQMTILSNPNLGLAELLSSGFDAVSTNRASRPLSTPDIRGIDNAGEGQLSLRLSPVANAAVRGAISKLWRNELDFWRIV